MKPPAKPKSQISFSNFFPSQPPDFCKPQSFLRFSSILLLLALFLEVLIDLTLEYEFTETHLSLRIALYLSILFSNGTLLLIPNIYPIKNFILISTFHLTTFLIRFFLYKDKNSSNFDFEIIPSALYVLPLYTISILLTPKPKFRLFLVFLHQIAILSLLNIKWNLTLNYNLKLLIGIFINLAVFWKISDFSLRKKKNTPNRTAKTVENEKFNLNSENDWKSLVNSIPQGIMLISHDKEILYSNNFSLDLLDLDSYTISSKPNLYQNLIKKFGKLEEIQYFTGNNNSEAPKPGEYGFTINESTFSGHNRNNNQKKKAFLGLNPVNIYSSRSFQSKFKVSGPISIGNPNNAGIFINWTKEKIDIDKRNSFSVNMGVSAKVSLGEKVIEKSEDVIESFKNYSPISIIPLHEMDLDSILNKMTNKPSRTFKCYYSEPSEANKRKLELKIQNICFENSPAFLLTIQDVSYLKFFQQVCENNEYKNKVLTTLSHELRTPLNGALIPLEKLRNESLENHGENFDFLDIAYKSMILLQDVLNDVVDFALINSNQLYLNYEELNIEGFLENTIDLFRKQATEKGLFLELIYENERIPSILKTDFQRLRQILVSLLNNALKNTFQGGISLIISLVEKSTSSFKNDFLRHCVKIIIKDTGVGIEDEKLNKIKKCLRTKDLMNVCENLNKNQGCGLGLIISHCLALLLGPSDSNGLKVNSQAMIGSEFSFCFESIQEKDQKSKNFEFNNKMKTMASFSTGDFGKRKKEKTDSEIISNEDFIYSGVTRDRKLCESQESTSEIINFVTSHTLQIKTMSEITGNFSDVLIVDDDSFNLMALEAILSKFNLKCVRAFNGQQALERILEKNQNFPQIQAFSIAFVDYHMPIKNGLETTMAINKMFKEDGVLKFPIIGCTAFGAKDLVEQWSEAGVDDFVIKPVSFRKIEGILRNFDVLK